MNAVDTNVLVYAKDPRDPRKQQIAQTLIATMPEGALFWQVACEFLAVSRKLEPFGYSLREAWDDLEELGSTWKTVPPRWEIQRHACGLIHATAFRFGTHSFSVLATMPESNGCILRTLTHTMGLTGWKSSIRFSRNPKTGSIHWLTDRDWTRILPPNAYWPHAREQS